MATLPGTVIFIAIAFACLGGLVQGTTYYYYLTATSSDQYFISPNYPSSYPTSNTYYYLISTTCGTCSVYIQVVDIELESSLTCAYDYIRVYDGTTIYNTLLGTTCGTNTMTVQGTSTSVYVKFYSDSSNTYRGFRILYKEVDVWSNIGTIIGIAVGAIVGVAVIIVIIACLVVYFKGRGRSGRSVNPAPPPTNVRITQATVAPPPQPWPQPQPMPPPQPMLQPQPMPAPHLMPLYDNAYPPGPPPPYPSPPEPVYPPPPAQYY